MISIVFKASTGTSPRALYRPYVSRGVPAPKAINVNLDSAHNTKLGHRNVIKNRYKMTDVMF